MTCELRLAGLADAIQLGGQPAVAQLGGDLFGRLDQRDQDLREHRRIQPARVGNAASARRGNVLPNSRADESAASFVRQARGTAPSRMFFSRKLRRSSMTIMFLQSLRELRDELHVDRVAHPHLQDREHAEQAEVGQHVLEVRARPCR